MKRLSLALLCMTLLISVAWAAPDTRSAGDRDSTAHYPRYLIAQADGISRDEAARIAKRATGGRVLGVKRKGNSYKVKVLLEGERVRIVHVDARTGQIRN